MDKFWQFARYMLHYKRLLVVALLGALLDAVCAFGGLASLMWVIEQLFDPDRTVHAIVLEKLQSQSVQKWIGNQTNLAEKVPEDAFVGLAVLMGIIFIIAIIGSCGRFLHQYLAITVSLRSVMRIRKTVFQRLVHLPILTAVTEGVSDKVSRVMIDSGHLAAGFNALTSRAVRDVLLGSAFLAVAFVQDWLLTVIFLLCLPLLFIIIRKLGKRIRRAGQRALAQYGAMVRTLQEAMQALRVVKTHESEGYERRRFSVIVRRVLAEEMRARVARALASPLVELIAMAGVIVVALVAFWYIDKVDRNPAQLVKVMAALALAGAAFRPLANLNNDLQASAAAANRLDELLHVDVESAARSDRQRRLRRLPRHAQSVVFDNITFSYPGAERPAVADIHLNVEQGRTCAVVGGNGSGKTTLVGLLPRLYEPEHGRVLIDDVNVAECSLRSVRRQIAVVTQETILFDGTIADNLIYGSRHASHDRMMEAARRAHADEFIDELPDGYDTQIGEWGQRLSGGQRQRIAIARAILRNPAILILDEATSQIDADSEAKISAALADFMTGRTTFVIAHRLSTVVNADLIVVLDAGRIVATGKHDDLLAGCQAYQLLCRTQLQTASPATAS